MTCVSTVARGILLCVWVVKGFVFYKCTQGLKLWGIVYRPYI